MYVIMTADVSVPQGGASAANLFYLTSMNTEFIGWKIVKPNKFLILSLEKQKTKLIIKCLLNYYIQRSRLRRPISKIRMILLMDAKT